MATAPTCDTHRDRPESRGGRPASGAEEAETTRCGLLQPRQAGWRGAAVTLFGSRGLRSSLKWQVCLTDALDPGDLLCRLANPSKARQHGGYGKCGKKRRNSSDDWPEGEREERRALAVCSPGEAMNGCGGGRGGGPPPHPPRPGPRPPARRACPAETPLPKVA